MYRVNLHFCSVQRHLYCLALAIISFAFFSCYTFSGTTLPTHLKTIHILPVQNKTLDPILTEKLTQAVISGLQKRSNLRIVNEEGHAELSITLLSASRSPYNTSGSDVTAYQISMQAEVYFVDKVKADTLYSETKLPAYGVYRIDAGETETTGQQKAIDELVQLILDNTLAGW